MSSNGNQYIGRTFVVGKNKLKVTSIVSGPDKNNNMIFKALNKPGTRQEQEVQFKMDIGNGQTFMM